MSFGNTKTPCKPTGEAKYQIPMRATPESNGVSISITQLLRCKDRYFAFFDDSIRAEKCNPDFTEITIGEYEDLINSDKEG